MIAVRTDPDPTGRAMKLVIGWWCLCIGEGAGVGHHASECERRVQVQEWVATYPEFVMPAWRRSGGEQAAQVDRGPIVRCRGLLPADPVPPAAVRMRKAITGRAVSLTYAKGWGKRLVAGAGDDGKGKFLPCPVESVALRASGLCAVAWVRREGEQSWTCDAAYAVWEGRIWPVNVTAVTALIRATEGRA